MTPPTTEPERSFEIEDKYDVDADTIVPDWSVLGGVAVVEGPDRRSLDALYLDTSDSGLARRGVAIRRRTGGPDAGWHLKGPLVDEGRVELRWPLGEENTIPAAIHETAAEWAVGDLVPLARIRNERDAYTLRNAEGAVIAEFVDDYVDAEDLRTGVTRSWREWEFELGAAAPGDREQRQALLAAVRDIAYAHGARAASSASKIARALGA